jgi:hypothetical protein
MEIIRAWDAAIRRGRSGQDTDDTDTAPVEASVHVSSYEDPILHIIRENKCEMKLYPDFEYPKDSGQRGKCYAFITSALHGALGREKISNLSIPGDVSQFGARIRSEQFQRFKLLTERDGVPSHRSGQRIGVWIPTDEVPSEPAEPAQEPVEVKPQD